MVLQDIFDHLTHGELVQINLGAADQDEGIREEDRVRVLSSIELGLSALFKRFKLKEGEVTIELQDDTRRYLLHSDFAQSNVQSVEPVKYLDDSVDAFSDELIKIEQVFDDEDRELLLNVKGDIYSLRTPDTYTLYVPEKLIEKTETETLQVRYRKKHPKIDKILGPALAFQQTIELPDAYLEPLLYFVASRIMTPIGVATEFNEGNNYFSKYEQACLRLEGQNFQIDDRGEQDGFIKRGWV